MNQNYTSLEEIKNRANTFQCPPPCLAHTIEPVLAYRKPPQGQNFNRFNNSSASQNQISENKLHTGQSVNRPEHYLLVDISSNPVTSRVPQHHVSIPINTHTFITVIHIPVFLTAF